MIVKICLKASSNKNTPFSELMQELLQYCFTSCICCIMANMGFGGFCVLKFLCFHLIFKKHNHTFLLFYFNMLIETFELCVDSHIICQTRYIPKLVSFGSRS